MGWRDNLAVGLGPRLRAILDIGDDEPLTAEALLLQIVDAVHEDEPRELSDKDVKKAGKRRQRIATAAGLAGGPVGLKIAGLYCEAAILCDVVDRHRLPLSDEQITAHLLVLWGAMPDVGAAAQAIDGTGPSVMAHAAVQLHDKVFDKPPSEMTKVEVVKALWGMRDLAGDVTSFEGGGPKDLFLPGGRVKAVTQAAERQLGFGVTG